MTGRTLRTLALSVVFLIGVLLAAAPLRDVESALRDGNAAFQAGKYAEAIALYEQVETISTDPKKVAFNLAVARFCLAHKKTEGRSAELREAEKLFRCAQDENDPRHAQALYGLGWCLLPRASNPEELKETISCFTKCEQAASADIELQTAARQGLTLARLRLAQYQATQSRDREDPANNKDDQKPDRRDQRPQPAQPGDGSQQGFDKGNKGTKVPVKADANGPKPKHTDDSPPPGANPNLPPVPDQPDLPPLSPLDAAAHLDQASRRILEEEKAYRQRKQRPAAKGVRDW